MLYVDGMNGVIGHNETIQWLYTLIGSKFRLVVKTALKLLLVFVEYTESNTQLLIEAVCTVDTKRGTKIWSNAMEILDEKDGVDTELLVYAMTLVNKTLAGLPDQDSFYDVVDCLEEQGIEVIAQRHLNKKGTDLDLVEQFNIYEMTLRHEDGDDDGQPPPAGRKNRRRASLGGANERRGLERRRSRRHSIQNTRGATSAPASPSSPHSQNTNGFMSYNGQRIEDLSENGRLESHMALQGGDQSETESVFEAEFAPWPIWFLFTCCLARFLSSLPPPPLLVPPYFNHREEENEEEEEEQPITEPNTEDEGEEEPSRQVKHSVVSQSPVIDNVEQANAIYSPKYVANIIPISEEDRPLNNPTAKNSPATSPRATGSTDRPNSSHLYVSPPPSVLTSLLANRRSPTTTSRTGCQGSSANITPAVSPTVEKLPYLPHSPFHLFSYDFDEPSPSTVKETEAEAMSQADATCSSKYSDSNDPYSSRYSSGRYNSYGSSSSPYTSSKSYSTLSAPTTPTSRYGTSVSPSPDSKTDRPVLGGLLTSSYRQHQESLAAERERRRQEREERLLRIEREERNKFNCTELYSLVFKVWYMVQECGKVSSGGVREGKEPHSAKGAERADPQPEPPHCVHLACPQKTAADGKRQEIIVLDSKRSNAINIGMTVLPPPRTIKTAILNFDEYALNKEGIEKILTMIPTVEEKQKIQEAQLATPDIPLGSAEQFLLTLSSISELSARLQLWAFKMDYELTEKEVAEPLQDLKEGMDQLENNKTLRHILSTLLTIGNFLNASNAKGFELSYLEKVPEVKDTVHKQSLLHHTCTIVVEKIPDSTDLYSEIGAITRSAKVDFEQLQENLCQMERRCKASWDHLKVIAKHEMKPALKQKMSEFLKDCAERIIILKIVHRRIINRFHAFLLFMGHPFYAIREVNINKFCKIISEFALEYRTTRERVLQQKQKRANHRERNKTRGKMITDSGKFSSNTPSSLSQPQGLEYAEDAAEHENMKAVLKTSLQSGESSASVVPGLRTRTRTRANRGRVGSCNPVNDDSPNATDDAADEIMDRIVKSATQVPSQRAVPRERKRSRANRKSLRRTLKSGLTAEEAKALGLSTSEMQV
ncbi:FH1/FH2 domain-containing protein 3 [Acipenser ruthenus]|uniref:FH1/FH2 domain-containing protein 3 n=1 Tax=Acipenser ruthenus TaxID=7906 RepID=A0A444UK64_ACIRT|nr:FH1/FH2 domain-containing protein 3 [Acipenser ruthenus]